MSVELIHTVEVANVLGEGVLWNERTQSVWWTDIESSRLFQYELPSGLLKTWDTPYRVACFGFIEGSDNLIVAFDQGIAIYDVRSKTTDCLVAPGLLSDGIRFNDGKIDATGRFWVGTMVEDSPAAAGDASLYCLGPDAGPVERICDITISNGLCWSPDGKVMYHTDSPTCRIDSYRYDANQGTVSEQRTFAETSSGAYPDGSTVDAEGGVWNAQWGGGQVVRYTANGQVDLVIELPVSQPSCVAFGGAGRNLLFVTSARQGLSAKDFAAEPGAGNLFVYRTDFKGLLAFNFK